MTGPVVVVGGGIAGLVTAWDLHRRGQEVVVLEADDHLGGKIGRVTIAGREVDNGADAFLARVPWAVQLCRDLGIADELVAPASGHAWLWSRAKLRELPAGLVLGVPSRLGPLARARVLSPAGLLRAALDEVWPRSARARTHGEGADDVAVRDAIGRHLGREVVDRLVDPLLGGINAGSCDRLSLAVAAPQLMGPSREGRLMRALRAQAKASATSGASVRTAASTAASAMSASPATSAASGLAANTGVTTHEAANPVFLTPRGGTAAIIDALVAQLPSGAIRTSVDVSSIERDGHGWRLGGVEAAHLVLATPAWVTSDLIRPHCRAAAALIGSVAYASVAMCLFALDAAHTRLPPGSGMLVPKAEGRVMTAASFYDQKWTHRVQRANGDVDWTGSPSLVRVSAGKIDDTRAFQMSDEELVERLHAELVDAVRTVPGCTIDGQPIEHQVVRWPRAFPQYDVGHSGRMDQAVALLADEAPGLHATGAAYRGVGIASCVREARALAARIAGDGP